MTESQILLSLAVLGHHYELALDPLGYTLRTVASSFPSPDAGFGFEATPAR